MAVWIMGYLQPSSWHSGELSGLWLVLLTGFSADVLTAWLDLLVVRWIAVFRSMVLAFPFAIALRRSGK